MVKVQVNQYGVPLDSMAFSTIYLLLAKGSQYKNLKQNSRCSLAFPPEACTGDRKSRAHSRGRRVSIGTARKIGGGCAGENGRREGKESRGLQNLKGGWRLARWRMGRTKGKEEASVAEPPSSGGSATQTVSEDAELLEAEAWIIGVV